MPCGSLDHLVPARAVLAAKPSSCEVADQHFGREDAHHELLAERGGHRRDAQLDLLAVRRHGLDAAVLRAALLDDVHARQELDARRSWPRSTGVGNRVDLVQHAVDAEAHDARRRAAARCGCRRRAARRRIATASRRCGRRAGRWRRASPCRPSSTSCSKLRASETSPRCVSSAFFIERARLKNSPR